MLLEYLKEFSINGVLVKNLTTDVTHYPRYTFLGLFIVAIWLDLQKDFCCESLHISVGRAPVQMEAQLLAQANRETSQVSHR